MDLCCCKDKDCMGRRLFQRLQKCVVSALCQHVNFVDDVHLVLADGGRESNLVREFTDLLNAVVGCCVDFNDVKVVTESKLQTHVTLSAR